MLTSNEFHIEMRKDKPFAEAIEIAVKAVESNGPTYQGIADALKVTTETAKRWIERHPALKKAWEKSKEASEANKSAERKNAIELARMAVKDAEKEAKYKQNEFMRNYATMSRIEVDKAVARCSAAHEPVREAKKELRKLVSAEKSRERRAEKKAEEENK